MQVGALTLILNSTWKYDTTVRYGDNNNFFFHRSVKCVEINKESELSFEKSVSRLPKTIDSTISWHNTDASLEPLHWLEGSDVVIVDPPRKGLHPSLIDALRNFALSERKISQAPDSIEVLAVFKRGPRIAQMKKKAGKKKNTKVKPQ
ncbi:hypothetical protein GW17_00040170 [Ensete ventricosum]|nr:hypothetical protein GW17_00040170 [Ensete ventricosum]